MNERASPARHRQRLCLKDETELQKLWFCTLSRRGYRCRSSLQTLLHLVERYWIWFGFAVWRHGSVSIRGSAAPMVLTGLFINNLEAVMNKQGLTRLCALVHIVLLDVKTRTWTKKSMSIATRAALIMKGRTKMRILRNPMYAMWHIVLMIVMAECVQRSVAAEIAWGCCCSCRKFYECHNYQSTLTSCSGILLSQNSWTWWWLGWWQSWQQCESRCKALWAWSGICSWRILSRLRSSTNFCMLHGKISA